MTGWFQATQSKAYKAHVDAKGATASWGVAIGVGFISLLVICTLLFGVMMLLPDHLFE